MSISCLNGDCIEMMKNLPDKSVDMFFCDLPYGGCVNCKWDIRIEMEPFWEQVKRLAKDDHTPVIMFCDSRFGNYLYNSNPSWFRFDLIWSKGSGSNFLQVNQKPLPSHELIYVFSKKKANYYRLDEERPGMKPYVRKYNEQELYGPIGGDGKSGCFGSIKRVGQLLQRTDSTRCSLTVLNFKRIQSKKHPTCKPLPLCEWLIKRFSKEGDTVLDPTAGSFNSGVASANLNRNYIGIELDPDYFEKNRIDKAAEADLIADHA